MSRGNATSGEPICSGTRKFANANAIGVANISSISVPCIVNSWLNCSFDRYCRPGRASSIRISSAMIPAKRKNPKAVTPYITAMSLWDVVRR